MLESKPVQEEAVTRKARVVVTRTFGGPCPIGYKEGESVSVDLNDPEGSFRCQGVREALEPFLEAGQHSPIAESLEFAASCHCPHSKAEVVFYLHLSPPLRQARPRADERTL